MFGLLIASTTLLAMPHAMPAAAGAQTCLAPVTYALESLDPRFKLSREEALQVLARGAGLWNTLKPGVVRYGQGVAGAVKVSFVYDERQMREESIQAKRIALQKEVKDFNTLAATLKVVGEQLTLLQKTHEAKAAGFTERQMRYEREVATINARGGGTKSEVAAYDALHKALLAEQEAYNQKVLRINALVTAVNAISELIRSKQVSLEVAIQDFNKALALEPNPEAGLYVRNAQGTFIEIYAYPDLDNLARVVAHEFGHALGLEHIPDHDAIMHAVNYGDLVSLSPEDVGYFRSVCGQ